jgi:type IV secretory pathway TrbD component
MAKIFRTILGITLIIVGLSIAYLILPMIFQDQWIVTGFGIALTALAVAVAAGGAAILRGDSIKEILLMLHLSS